MPMATAQTTFAKDIRTKQATPKLKDVDNWRLNDLKRWWLMAEPNRRIETALKREAHAGR